MKYLNAKEVLPPGLFMELRRRRTLKGCYLYIPFVSENRNQDRDVEIRRLHQEEGLPAEDIARRFYLSPRRVRQILRPLCRKTT